MRAMFTGPQPKILMLGVGEQGGCILDMLLKDGFHDIHIVDKNTARVTALTQQYGNAVRACTDAPDCLSGDHTDRFVKSYDAVIDSLPARFSWPYMQAAARTGTNMVSVSFLEEDFMSLDGTAAKNGSLIIPDAGAAPGLVGLMAAHGSALLDGADVIIEKLGALSARPTPPYFHANMWCTTDLMEEYIRQALVRVDGELKRVDPLQTIEREIIRGMGEEMESFITDGVRSQAQNLPAVKTFIERTLRIKGHLAFMKNLFHAGALSYNDITLPDGSTIKAYELLAKILDKQFGNLPAEDRFVMDITASKGSAASQRRVNIFYLMAYDHKNKIGALTKAVALTAYISLRLMLDGTITEKGVYPLERLGHRPHIYQAYINAHREAGARIDEESAV
ncbi:MAG: saccharopine dehydrogenase NADP-binding domain-containing protein [Deltaproteobacteria bacterium]|nr:saccharopine dehydrogenase NADP-binding domain-containing protein [Deltaproteobacteria bacterium]